MTLAKDLSTAMNNERVAWWERLLVGVSTMLIAAAIIGVYNVLWNIQESTSQSAANIQLIQQKISTLRDRANQLYSTSSAIQIHEQIRLKDASQDEDLEDHENRLRDLERHNFPYLNKQVPNK